MPAAMRPGDVVAVLAAPEGGFPVLMAEAWDRGAAVLPVDPRLADDERFQLLARARPTLVVDGASSTRLQNGTPDDRDVALVVATSGSRGTPKLVELGRGAVEAAVTASLAALRAEADDRWLCCVPVAHIGGLLVILRALFAGAPLTVHAGFDPAAVAADGDGAFVSLVPTMLLRLLDAGCDAGRFACLLVGGAGLPTALAERARAAGARLVTTYGMTESCGGVVYDGTPLDGVGVRTGAAGEIELGGPTLMARYRDDADATVAAFTTDGWLRTGDSGWVDGAGRLHVAGRLDDLILTGGEKVWPAEVEAVLADHPLVAQVAVSARPDPEWGQRVVAHVVPRRAENAPTLSGLRRFAAGRLARYKAPAELVVVDRLPPRDRKLALPEPGAPGGVRGPGRPAGDGPLVQ